VSKVFSIAWESMARSKRRVPVMLLWRLILRRDERFGFSRDRSCTRYAPQSVCRGFFSPTRQDDRWLIDGGLVNPVPVSLARALGAEIVIAVDLNSELVGRRFSGSGIEVTASPTAPAVSAQAPQWLMDAAGPILQRVLQARPDYPSYFEVLANSLNIMQDRITRTRLAGDPPDVLLCPRLGEFSWLDLHRANEAIAEGLACVQAAEPMIRRACRDAIADA